MARLSLRRLVVKPHELIAATSPPARPSGTLDVPASARGAWLPHPLGVIRLPEHEGAALEDLRSARERSNPLLLPEELRDSAWAGLVATPSVTVPLAADGPLELEKYWPGPVDRSWVRRVGLATVFTPPDETLTAVGISATRAAASAILTLLVSGDSGRVERAYLEAEWHHSALGLLSGLERLEAMALERGASIAHEHRVGLLIHPTTSPGLGDSDRARLAVVADLLECGLQIIDRLTLDSRTIGRRVADSPRMLLAVGPVDASTTELISLHQAAGHDRFARTVQPSGTRSLTDEIAEALLGLSGVGAALMPVLPPSSARKTRLARPRMPFPRASQCRHLGSRVYVEDPETELWWTRDDDRHAESIFKTYTRLGEKLLHEADRHEHGEVVKNKHKGPSGEVINLADCHRCGKPDKHRK